MDNPDGEDALTKAAIEAKEGGNEQLRAAAPADQVEDRDLIVPSETVPSETVPSETQEIVGAVAPVSSTSSVPMSRTRQIQTVFRKALFFPSLAYNALSEKFTSRTWYNRIDDHVILGALPFRSVIASVAATENVKGIISFNEDYEVNPRWYATSEEMAKLGIKHVRLPVEDYTASPSLTQVQEGLKFIEDVKKEGGTVYIHCKAGRFRSAFFASAYVIASQKLRAEPAVLLVQEKRPQMWLGPKQIRKLQMFHNR